MDLPATPLPPLPLAPARTAGAPAAPGTAAPGDPLRSAARAFEAAFLAEMLQSAGLGSTRESMGGGAGEGQFASFLVRAQAEEIARAGGIGLAEALYASLKETAHDPD